MSLLIFGSTALDSISTLKKKNPRLLGGSGSHAAVAASFFGIAQVDRRGRHGFSAAST